VADSYQGLGLGTELLSRLVRVAQDEGLHQITAEILVENVAMQRVCEKVGFQLHRSMDIVKAELEL
jgi:acetyltransferase